MKKTEISGSLLGKRFCESLARQFRRPVARYLSSGLPILPLLVTLSSSRLPGRDQEGVGADRLQKVRLIIDEFRSQLGISELITVVVSPHNERLVSVERHRQQSSTFVLSFDKTFLSGLDDSDLSAAIAHELGHIWIYTHHPYLQTELLANQIAQKVVSRQSLTRVYQKVSLHNGEMADLDQLLGNEQTSKTSKRTNEQDEQTNKRATEQTNKRATEQTRPEAAEGVAAGNRE